jgi:hypothetical protein
MGKAADLLKHLERSLRASSAGLVQSRNRETALPRSDDRAVA